MRTELFEQMESYLSKPFIKSFQSKMGQRIEKLNNKRLPGLLFISSYPPRECGIATYTQDLLKALKNKFINSFQVSVCALESGPSHLKYPEEVRYVLDTKYSKGYIDLAKSINADPQIQFVVVQHEFGFFKQEFKSDFLNLLKKLNKPVVLVFHTVLPNPNPNLKEEVKQIVQNSAGIVVMTHHSAQILQKDYGVESSCIEVIAHGTHLVPHLEKSFLKEKHGLGGRKVLSTFGLLSSGKSIETTLNALPEIIRLTPELIFLIIGKTHPDIVEVEGEQYRGMLKEKIIQLNLQNHVRFYNQYLPLVDLLEFLQLSDIYLFTSKDPFQAVSGTFSYAMSCACPIISTPIPHAREVLNENTGIIIDFGDSKQLAAGVNRIFSDEQLMLNFGNNTLQQIVPTAWENSALRHAGLIQKLSDKFYSKTELKNSGKDVIGLKRTFQLDYRLPPINTSHIKKLTTPIGIIQFAVVNHPDISSGYTLDDTARALIALCMNYQDSKNKEDLQTIHTYLEFILFCQQDRGDFLNYVDADKKFTYQNTQTNLADSNGRAIWALGFLISLHKIMPPEFVALAERMVAKAHQQMEKIHSPRAMAFAIKGLCFHNQKEKSLMRTWLIQTLANRLLQMYYHESEDNWNWFESYLTYANGVLPEAMLCAWKDTGTIAYKEVAKSSFDFLLTKIFSNNKIKVISNQTWLKKGDEPDAHGEQPIDVCYVILCLELFYEVFKQRDYSDKLIHSFNWFLGNNHLNHIVYNPCTGGCFDGLEAMQVNLNQGAESTLSYFISRHTIARHLAYRKNEVQLPYRKALAVNM